MGLELGLPDVQRDEFLVEGLQELRSALCRKLPTNRWSTSKVRIWSRTTKKEEARVKRLDRSISSQRRCFADLTPRWATIIADSEKPAGT